jgi:hypothetical protein
MKHDLKEEVDITPYVERGNIDVDNDPLRDNINTFLHGVTGMCFITPYIALEKVSKVLANFHIHLNRTFLEDEDGYVVFPVRQFGNVMGMKNDGQVVTKVESPYHVYFEWRMKSNGLYNIFCELVDSQELEELIQDYENEDSDEEEKDEYMKEEFDNKPTKNKVPIKIKMNDGSIKDTYLEVPSYAKLYPEYISREIRLQHGLKRNDYDTAVISAEDVKKQEMKEATLAGPETGPKPIDGAPDPFKKIKDRIMGLREQMGQEMSQRRPNETPENYAIPKKNPDFPPAPENYATIQKKSTTGNNDMFANVPKNNATIGRPLQENSAVDYVRRLAMKNKK